jgi:hypothetical protein
MFSVLFEAHPKSDQWEAYLGYVKSSSPNWSRSRFLSTISTLAASPVRGGSCRSRIGGTTACLIDARRRSTIPTLKALTRDHILVSSIRPST